MAKIEGIPSAKVGEIVSGKFRLRYYACIEMKKGCRGGIPYHRRWIRTQCIIEFDGDSSSPHPIAFIIRTRREHIKDFNPNFEMHLLRDCRDQSASDVAHGNVLKLLWAHLHDGRPLLPFPSFDLEYIKLVC